MRCRNALAVVLTAGVIACGEPAVRRGPARIQIDTTRIGAITPVLVVGFSRSVLKQFRDKMPAERFGLLLRVTVAGQDSVAVQGRYAVTDTSVEFRPAFPFDPGRRYVVRFQPAYAPVRGPELDSVVIDTPFMMASPAAHAAAVVEGMMPTADTLPENLLRVYLEFSQPMSREPGAAFVHLLDDTGKEVTHAFLPLEADFWNAAHTRYTVFLDPGRVKRGILPNEQLGRALRAGRTYSLVVDSTWRDAQGSPLARGFRRFFRAGPATLAPLSINAWTVAAPKAGSRDTMVVLFPAPLDHGLLQRALGVETSDGKRVPGTIEVGRNERSWRFIPTDPWTPGNYKLVALAILEDVAGNGIGHGFEVDMFTRSDSTSAPERYVLPFTIR